MGRAGGQLGGGLRPILDLAPDVVVPGHGPVCDTSAVADQRDYFAFLERRGHAPGRGRHGARSTRPATSTSAPTPTWASASGSRPTCLAVYRDLGHDVPADALSALDQMAAYGAG